MDEKIIVEQINFTKNEGLQEFPEINKLLSEGWTVKSFKEQIFIKPVSIYVIAVLQKIH